MVQSRNVEFYNRPLLHMSDVSSKGLTPNTHCPFDSQTNTSDCPYSCKNKSACIILCVQQDIPSKELNTLSCLVALKLQIGIQYVLLSRIEVIEGEFNMFSLQRIEVIEGEFGIYRQSSGGNYCVSSYNGLKLQRTEFSHQLEI